MSVPTIGARCPDGRALPQFASGLVLQVPLILTIGLLLGMFALPLVGSSLALVRLGCGLLVTAAGIRALPRLGGGESPAASPALCDWPFAFGPSAAAGSIAFGSHLAGTAVLLGDAPGLAAFAALPCVVLMAWISSVGYQQVSGTPPPRFSTGTVPWLKALLVMAVGLQMMWVGWATSTELS
jgi:hypothetical protein